jgi:hypothetical protein
MCCLSGAIAPTISLAVKSNVMGFRLHPRNCLLRGKIPLLVLAKPTRLLPASCDVVELHPVASYWFIATK